MIPSFLPRKFQKRKNRNDIGLYYNMGHAYVFDAHVFFIWITGIEKIMANQYSLDR